jgi:hypothetical protein
MNKDADDQAILQAVEALAVIVRLPADADIPRLAAELGKHLTSLRRLPLRSLLQAEPAIDFDPSWD